MHIFREAKPQPTPPVYRRACRSRRDRDAMIKRMQACKTYARAACFLI